MEPYSINFAQDSALNVDGDFEWESLPQLEDPRSEECGSFKFLTEENEKNEENESGKREVVDVRKEHEMLPSTMGGKSEDTQAELSLEEKPFVLRDLILNVPRGAFVAIIGGIGSGKVCSVFCFWLNHGRLLTHH